MPKMTMPGGAAWQDFTVDTKLITPNVIRLKIKPSFRRDLLQRGFNEIEAGERGKKAKERTVKVGEIYDHIVKHVLSLIEAWDLSDDDGSMPCTDELKLKYLEPLFWESVIPKAESVPAEGMMEAADEKEDEPKAASWLWAAVLEFATEFNNFTKN
jgi:hypothetical protein